MINSVYIEGCDLSGKTTQFKELWKLLQENKNYSIDLHDRSYFSVLCYGEYYNRYSKEEIETIKDNLLHLLNNNRIIFYIKVSVEELIKRYELRLEKKNISEVLGIKEVYDKYAEIFNKHYNFHIIDDKTTEQDISKTIMHLMNTLNPVIFCNFNTIIENFGKNIKNTKEIVNFCMYEELAYDSIKQLSKNLYYNLHKLKEKNINYILEYDSYEYMFSAFKKKIESEISGYYGKKQDIEGRRFVFTDDECLSFLHIMFRNKELIVNAHFRSSNVDIFVCDILSIYNCCTIFADKFKELEVNSSSIFLPNISLIKKVKLSIHIDSFHKIKE